LQAANREIGVPGERALAAVLQAREAASEARFYFAGADAGEFCFALSGLQFGDRRAD
jgi:hypothetical protein